MQSILITYDFVGTDETSADYKRLIDHIKNDYSNWAKIALSTWVVRTTLSAAQVGDNCDRYLDSNDRLFVAVLTGAAAWRNTICTSEWLRNNL